MRKKLWVKMICLVTALLLLMVWTVGCKDKQEVGEQGTTTTEVSGTQSNQTTTEPTGDSTPAAIAENTPEPGISANPTAQPGADNTTAATVTPVKSTDNTTTQKPTATQKATATPKTVATPKVTSAPATAKPTVSGNSNATVKTAKFIVTDDSAVQSNQSVSPKGQENTIGINWWPSEADPGVNIYKTAYLKFEVKGISGAVKSAKLVLNYRGQGKGIVDGKTNVYAVSDKNWTEDTINWSNKPAIGAKIAEYDNPTTYPQIVEVDIGSYIKGNGIYSICLESTSQVRTTFHTSEWEGTDYHPYISVSYQ